MYRFAFPLGMLLSTAMPSLAQAPATSTLLSSMRDQTRPLLIFAGPSDPRVAQQYRDLATNAAGVQDRQIRLILATTAPTPSQPKPPSGTVAATQQEQQTLRTQFHIPADTFTVILIGKDGGEKFRSSTPVSFATLTHIIDAMPMRQQETRAH